MKVKAPPIKCQGIKTKLVPLIQAMVDWDRSGMWIEPFTGSGVVGFNICPRVAIFSDTNPHTIGFYQAIQQGDITPDIVRRFLTVEGKVLAEKGDEHYYAIRDRFNKNGDPLDFLFLNRACFNGVMRFNRKGGFNVPFCRKPNRFAQALVTKIVNQVAFVFERAKNNSWSFVVQDFETTIQNATRQDFIYADPPYVGRHGDEIKEHRLFNLLKKTGARFMLSTWEENSYRRNNFIDSLWREFPRVNEDHFYHVGAKESNRNPMKEALLMNYQPPSDAQYREGKRKPQQIALAI
jgi:DNA adenine methylase